MSDKHEVLDLSSIRREAPAAKLDPVEAAKARIRGKAFSQLSPSERDDLMMIVGCQMGLILPENDGP